MSLTDDQSSIYYRCPYYCNGCNVQFCLMFKKYKDCEYYKYIKEKDELLPMENKTLEKTLDVAGSVAKIAANLSDAKKDTRQQPFSQTDDNSNKASTGSQTVVVSMDGKKKEPKPIEKHIHEFPEARALTEQECDLALKKATMDYNLKKSEQDYIQYMEDKKWRYQLEQNKKNEKKRRIRNIITGILGALCIGGVGYSIYVDYRDHKNDGETPKLPTAEPIKANGKVK